MQDFRKVKAWQANRELVVMIYRVSASFPREERFGLSAQVRDAAISIGANIAEGCGRGTRPDTLRYFQIAFSSATEVLHHLITAQDLGYLTDAQFAILDARLDSVRRMLAGFMRRLRG